MNDKLSEQSPDALRAMVTGVLSTFKHPTLKNNLTTLNALHHCALLDGVLHIELTMPFVWLSGLEVLKETVSAELLRLSGATVVEWRLSHNIATLRRVNDQPGIKGVKNIIAVSSGKGGVGKSSTAVNMALALAAEGASVGILDADIYGPSIPTMLGAVNERPTSPDGQHMAPIMAHGLATNSIGYLVTDDNAMVWRGPMASKALLQLLQDTLWPDLDYLVLDMPPGTGDIQLTLAQSVPVTGAVVVTTPQDIALVDAMKGIVMFEKVNVPVLGVVENMSVHICSNCGHLEPIFGTGGAQKLVDKYHCVLLGQLPLHISLREDLDRGEPTVVSHPDSEFTSLYRELADRVAAQLYWQGEVIPTEIAVRSL
ncbi:iron-sulfur cluster carrier protein ApbC [Pectobacteriaceae bacterium CE90]|nr:iron-sulfur cluster carrier protein ApbC [Prodigiosinella sp. LS101]WJV55249.1 iron-sulfur cluster carrier protein ApbC [Prodigiosinella sp. LS101]WJV59610.1 iron-sulfur cluster carrier protein ApbC [Pectobacteriaceae bacterium C111]WJY13860.1 iron-sulfur cluster carrier protein ApbC [Pectobacteriaceae bacterium CE90]